jgi:hypothetical protein
VRQGSNGGPCWAHYSAAPDLTPGSWFLGDAPPEHLLIGVGLLHLGSWHSPQGHCGFSLPVKGVASRHVPSANALRRRLMVSRPLCLVEEL